MTDFVLAMLTLAQTMGDAEDPGFAGFKLRDLVLLAAVLLILTALFMGIRKKRRRGDQHSITAHEHLHRLKEEQGVRGDLEGLMVQIEQMAKRLGAQLDAKAQTVEHLLKEADQRIALLNQTTHHADAEERGDEASGIENQQPPPPPPPPRDALTQSVFDLADAGKSSQEIAQETGEHLGKVELILALRRAEQRES